MSNPELSESTDRLEIRSPLRRGARLLFAAFGLIPLIAPYELIIRPGWEEYLNVSFLIAAFVAAGAVTVSASLFFAAVAGSSSRIVLDRRTGKVLHSAQAPAVRLREHEYALSDVRAVEVGVTEWSDSSPSYHLRLILTGDSELESGSSWSREEIEQIRARIERFLGTAVSSAG